MRITAYLSLMFILADQIFDAIQIVIRVISHHQLATLFCRLDVNLGSQPALQLLCQIFDKNIFFLKPGIQVL